MSQQLRICDEITEETWCQGVYAMDRSGSAIIPMDDPRACKWCLLGWIIKMYELGMPAAEVTEKLLSVLGFEQDLSRFNDTHSFEEVKALVCKAGV